MYTLSSAASNLVKWDALMVQMGKANFGSIYRGAVEDLGRRPCIKISSFCDTYSPHNSYAGIITYHSYGQYTWQQRPGQGVAGVYRGRAFYVLIVCTDTWPTHALRDAGQGRVHDYLYCQYSAMGWSRGRTCCGGFSIQHWATQYSSVWLNTQSGNVRGKSWRSDGSKYLSAHEESLVDIAIDCWKDRGSGAVVRVPDWLDS